VAYEKRVRIHAIVMRPMVIRLRRGNPSRARYRRLAAVVVAGLAGTNYDSMRASYEHAVARRWSRKRRLGRLIRGFLKHPRVAVAGFRMSPEFWFRKLWE
jgi:hypothetical protein